MTNRLLPLVAALLLAACATPPSGPADSLDAAARDYVRLQLAIGEKEEGYIDAYYGPAGLQAEVAAAVPAARSTTSWGTPALDLPAGARSQLERLGVSVEYCGPCTLETDSLFSYRRDKNTGRFAGVVWCHD